MVYSTRWDVLNNIKICNSIILLYNRAVMGSRRSDHGDRIWLFITTPRSPPAATPFPWKPFSISIVWLYITERRSSNDLPAATSHAVSTASSDGAFDSFPPRVNQKVVGIRNVLATCFFGLLPAIIFSVFSHNSLWYYFQ